MMQTDFETALAALLPGLKRGYQRGINSELSRHQWQGMFGRQVLRLTASLLADCEPLIDRRGADQTVVQPDWSALRERINQQREALVDFALQFNRSSCALSNFPDEHSPSADYFSEVLAAAEQQWQHWCEQQRSKQHPVSAGG